MALLIIMLLYSVTYLQVKLFAIRLQDLNKNIFVSSNIRVSMPNHTLIAKIPVRESLSQF